jgi:hypothetical protein
MSELPEIRDSSEMPAPTPTSELDETLKGVADETNRLLKRIIMVMALVMAVMGIALVAVIVVAVILVRNAVTEKSRVDSYLSGQCPFFYPVAVLPVPANTSKLGVDLVEGARTALARQACPEKVPPPSSELMILGRKYDIPITY